MLRDLQIALADAFHAGGPPPDGAPLWAELLPLGDVTPADCVAVYRGAIANALEGALREIHPVCAALVGDDCFRSLARAYAKAHPSSHVDLARVGDALPELVPTLPFLDGVPYLADVAALERAWHAAWTAPDPAPSAAEGLAEALAAEPHRWRFRMPPSARLVESPHPVLEIWRAHREGPDGRLAADALDLRDFPGRDRLIVWRREAELRVDRVEDALWPLLASINAGEPVARQIALAAGVADERVTALLEDDAGGLEFVLDAIGSLFARGWIVGAEPVAYGPHAGHG